MTETPDPYAPPPEGTGQPYQPPQPQQPPAQPYPQQPYQQQPYPQQPYPQQPYPQQPYPQQPAMPPYGYQQPPAPSSGMAVAALVLGIVGLIFCPLTGPVAIILGIIGVRRAGRGEATGKGMAIAGIVLGVLGTLLMVVATAFIVWFFSAARDCFDANLSDAQVNACFDQVFEDKFGISVDRG